MKIENCKLKIKSVYSLLICLFVYLFICLFPPFARADGISLSVYPPLMRVKLNPPGEIATDLALQNQGNDPLNIQVLLKPFRPFGQTGQIEYLSQNQTPDDYKNILTKIKLTDQGKVTNNFDLGPKQKKNLKLEFNIPKNQKPSDYYFSVIFLASPKPMAEAGLASLESTSKNTLSPQTKAYSHLIAGIAANIIFSIGKEIPTAYIEEFSTPIFIESGPVGFTIRVKNAGKQLITPKGIILIKNIFGQTIGRLDLSPVNILSDSTRSLTNNKTVNTSSQLSTLNFQLSTPKAIWPEKFLLGPYTASLSLAVSDTGPIYHQSITFIALPVNLVLGAIAAIIIVIMTIFRIRKHLKTEK